MTRHHQKQALTWIEIQKLHPVLAAEQSEGTIQASLIHASSLPQNSDEHKSKRWTNKLVLASFLIQELSQQARLTSFSPAAFPRGSKHCCCSRTCKTGQCYWSTSERNPEKLYPPKINSDQCTPKCEALLQTMEQETIYLCGGKHNATLYTTKNMSNEHRGNKTQSSIFQT